MSMQPRVSSISWLERRLAAGPAVAGDVLREAREAGVSKADLYAAAKSISVKKDPPAGGPGCRWMLPDHERPEPAAVKPRSGGRRCRSCGEERPIDDFSINARAANGRERVCLTCSNARKRLSERIKADPECVAAVNGMVDHAPDPAPAIKLRAELRRQRARGLAFDAVWPGALSRAVAGLPPREQVSWRRAFSDTRAHWHASYSGYSRPRGSLVVLDPEDRIAAA